MHVKSAVSFFVVSNWRSCLLIYLLLSAVQASSSFTAGLTIFLCSTHPRLSTKVRPSTPWTLSSTHYNSLVVCIARRIGYTGEPCGTPDSTGWLFKMLPLITIFTILSERKLSVHCMRSVSICLVFIPWISLHLAMHGDPALISIRRTLVMLSSLHGECALSTMMAVA